MTREELDALEAKLSGWHDHQDFLIARKDYLALIAQARRAIELETCQCGRELSHVCLICDNDD